MNKICTKCKENKPLEEYNVNSNSSDSRRSECKSCSKEDTKKYRNQNKKKIAETQKKYRQKNVKQIKKYQLSYRRKNRDKVKKYREKDYTKNKEKILKKCRKYYINNKEKVLEYQQRYRTENKEKIKKYFKSDKGKLAINRFQHTRRANEINSIKNLKIEEKKIILFLQQFQCICCKEYFDKVEPTLDHILPLSKGGGLTKSNVQFLCQACNSSKGIQIIDYRTDMHKTLIRS